MNILLTILAVFSIIYSALYVWHKLLEIKIDYKSKKFYIVLISLMAIAHINYFNVNAYIRITVVTISLMIFFRILFKENLQKCIITPLFSQLLTMISEMIFVVVTCLIFNMDNQGIINTQFGQFLSNVIISLLIIAIIQIPFVRKVYKLLIKITDKISRKQLVVLPIFIILIANVLTMILYYRVQFRYLLIFFTLLTIFCFIIVIYYLKTKNNYNKVFDKYNTTLNSLKEYEDILDRYRVSSHENKNEILTIRNMIPKNNKKLINYIDTIIENKIKDNDKAIVESAKIPTGGIRGLVYSKILTMKDLNINYKLDISNEVRTVDLINNIDDATMLDICKVIGVYLDNSIQAVEGLKKKFINIEMYLEDSNLVIAISNNYEGVIDLNKIENKGYTSKGNGRGYGLTLAKQIIEKNNKLSNLKSISKSVFTQILKIEM